MSLNSIILRNNDTVTLENAYYRLRAHFGEKEDYLTTGKWGTKFKEIRDSQGLMYSEGELIMKISLIVFAFIALAALCIAAGLTGNDSLSMFLLYCGSIDVIIAGIGLFLVISMVICNAINYREHEKIKTLRSLQLDQDQVTEIVNEIPSNSPSCNGEILF